MPHFTTLTSRVVPLPVDDVDTDQIIPARFLKATDKSGLGAHLFADWRYLPDGAPRPGFILNQPEHQDAQILLAGHNFGCGSSREHAPWALTAFGFRAILAISFADIFCNNALKNGLLPIAISAEMQAQLLDLLAEVPAAELTIDLAAQTVRLPTGQAVAFAIDAFSKTCLLQGTDELGYLLGLEKQIAAYEAAAGQP